MARKNQFYRKKSKKVNLKTIVIVVMIVILASMMVERFMTQGTVLGYQVRNTGKTEQSTLSPDNVSSRDSSEKKSYACKQLPIKQVGKVLGSEVEKIGGIYEDRKEPSFISICSYRTKKTPSRIVTLIIRDAADKAAARKTLSDTAKNVKAKKINLADEAYYSVDSRQLIARKGKQIITVTVSEPTDHSAVDNQDAATKIAKLLLE